MGGWEGRCPHLPRVEATHEYRPVGQAHFDARGVRTARRRLRRKRLERASARRPHLMARMAGEAQEGLWVRYARAAPPAPPHVYMLNIDHGL